MSVVRNMSDDMVIYFAREVAWELCIEPAVLRHFAKNRQIGAAAPEVGGQLFAVFEKYRVRVVHATGPRKADHHHRYAFVPNRRSENREIKTGFGTGLHFIGDWHTHPEVAPKPSRVDLASMKDCFKKSQHSLTHFVMVIVGQQEEPSDLWVSLHDAKRCIRMQLRRSSSLDTNEVLVPRSGVASSPFARLKRALSFGAKPLTDGDT